LWPVKKPSPTNLKTDATTKGFAKKAKKLIEAKKYEEVLVRTM
jgi:hypothetical protein